MTQRIIEGDCFELIKKLPNESIDLVITSPPYADIMSYGKQISVMKPNDYVDWILPLFREIHRVLKSSGSFILNINDKCFNGYRSTYIFDLISRNNIETDLKLYDYYIWYKKNGIPNGGSKRFRNNTEWIFHFCKDKNDIKFYMDRVLIDHKESSLKRHNSKIETSIGTTDEGFQIKKSRNIKISKGVRPSNVFRFNTGSASRDNSIKHPAVFHKELPSYFINLLTDEGDIVLDPFSGIGTTCIASKELNRNSIGFEMNTKYVEFSKDRLLN